MSTPFETTPQCIERHAGDEVRPVRGRPFTYTFESSAIRPSTTDRLLGQAQFAEAHARWPVSGPGDLQDLQGPSYLLAVPADPGIAAGH